MTTSSWHHQTLEQKYPQDLDENQVRQRIAPQTTFIQKDVSTKSSAEKST
jgi:hypothetical protein